MPILRTALHFTICLLFFACTFITSSVASFSRSDSSLHTLRGVIVDASTAEIIPFATIRVPEIRKATYTSEAGEFIFNVPDTLKDSLHLMVYTVGYFPDTISVLAEDTVVRIELVERPFRQRQITVSAEDPAVAIMRAVLKRKVEQGERLRQYSYMLYTKFVAVTDSATTRRGNATSDSTVFAILESYAKGYANNSGEYANEIVQKRQTANIPPSANVVSFGTNTNAYEDEVSIVGERMFTPFTSGALDMYDFKLESSVDDDVVKISAKEKGLPRKQLVGTIFVNQRTSQPIDVQLTPTSSVNLPFDAGLSYRQTFTQVDSMVLPEALSVKSSLKADILFVFAPRLDITVENFCYDYSINTELPEDVFDKRRVESVEEANVYDSTYWRVHQKVPLNAFETNAYDEIRIAQENPDSLLQSTFIDRYLGPIPAVMARIARRPFSGFEDIVRYNRIHGLYLGMGIRTRVDTSLEVYAHAGYGFANTTPYGSAYLTYFIGQTQRWFADGGLFHNLDRRDASNLVRGPLVTLTTVLFGNDYGDYFQSTGWQAGIGYGWGQLRYMRNDIWGRPSYWRIGIRSERQASVQAMDVFRLFNSNVPVRSNPTIFDGSLTTLSGELALSYSPMRLLSRTGMYLRGEVSQPRLLHSDFEYWTVQWAGTLRTPTLPLWTLDVSATLGVSGGNVPPQKFSSLESSVSGVANGAAFRGMRVKEFYGDQYATLSFTHNFGEVIPGLLRIPNVASFGIEFLAFASVGYSAFSDQTRAYTQTILPSTQSTRDRMYYEVGLGINRLLLFLRFDVNVRLSQREHPQFWFTATWATF